MPITATQLDAHIAVGPEIDVEAWRLAVPARPATYVMEVGDGRPVTIATVSDLRGALLRRLGPDPVAEANEERATHRRIDYRAVVRCVRWRRVFSRFEGNWVYLENARELFPRTYRRLIRSWRAAWLGVDLDAPAPHFVASNAPVGSAATCFGPFPTLRSARRHGEMLEDLFDLCRYPSVLAQSPKGHACAYKQMGRCAAPCDGSIPMSEYRRQVDAAVGFMHDGGARWRADINDAMKRAAAERAYERAGRLKAMLDAARPAESPAANLIEPLDGFRFLVVQRGDRRDRARLFAVTPGAIEPLGQISKKDRADEAAALAQRAAAVFAAPTPASIDRTAVERIGLVAWHLLGGRREKGIFRRLLSPPDSDVIKALFDEYISLHATPPPPG